MEETLFLKKDMYTELEDYDFSGLKKALSLSTEDLINELKKAGLKGRGGAGFPTGIKWELARKENGEKKYIICNGDEGEPGTFKDRYLLENNPVKVLEGIMIAAYAIGADEGYCYIRGEYNKPITIFKKTIEKAYKKGILGEGIFGSDFDFNLQLVKGAGAYVCGDETSLLNSIEGKRGISRMKPPYPIERGLFDRPTVVNNVETLVSAVEILAVGADFYKEMGTEESRGTKLICLSGDIREPGVYEIEFGRITLKEIIEELGGGIRDGKELKFIVPGGISTAILTAGEINIPYTYEDLSEMGSSLGSGAVIVVTEGHNLPGLLQNVSRFFMDETCGTCFPCREGNRQVYNILTNNSCGFSIREKEIIKDIGKSIHLAARCGLGQTSLSFINSVFEKFENELIERGELDA